MKIKRAINAPFDVFESSRCLLKNDVQVNLSRVGKLIKAVDNVMRVVNYFLVSLSLKSPPKHLHIGFV